MDTSDVTSPNLPRRQQFVNVWRDSPDWLRTSTKVSVTLSIILFVLGVVADAQNWGVSEWGFAVNIYSSLTAFFLAVPIALVGLDAVSEMRRGESEILKVNNQTVKAWDRFANAVKDYCSPAAMDVLTVKFADPYRSFDKVRREIRTYVAAQPLEPLPTNRYMQQPQVGLDVEGYLSLRNKIEVAIVEIKTALDQIQSILPAESESKVRWFHLLRTWKVFSTEVQQRRDELDLASIDDHTFAAIDYKTSSEKHPLADLYQSRRRSKAIPDTAERMGDTPHLLQRLLDMNEADFLNTVYAATTNPFRRENDGSEMFLVAVNEARMPMLDLLELIENVDIRHVVGSR